MVIARFQQMYNHLSSEEKTVPPTALRFAISAVLPSLIAPEDAIMGAEVICAAPKVEENTRGST
jgi:hypothetical protein